MYIKYVQQNNTYRMNIYYLKAKELCKCSNILVEQGDNLSKWLEIILK